MSQTTSLKYWAIMPAAGCGMRMNADKPKQYLTIAGKTIIEHSLAPLLANNNIHKVVVAISDDDQHWGDLPLANHPKIITTIGGAERCHSVLNGLAALQSYADDQDWVLVHDAARPLLTSQDLALLMTTFSAEEVGGLLGAPIHCTIKQVNDTQEVLATVPRQHLWRALTPQMFHYGTLYQALKQTLPDRPTSDCSAAIEQLGFSPKMIEGRADNIKITRPADIVWAEKWLQNKGCV